MERRTVEGPVNVFLPRPRLISSDEARDEVAKGAHVKGAMRQALRELRHVDSKKPRVEARREPADDDLVLLIEVVNVEERERCVLRGVQQDSTLRAVIEEDRKSVV